MHNSYRVGFLDLLRSNEESEKKSEENKNSSSLTNTQKRVSKSLIFFACLVFVFDIGCAVTYVYLFNGEVYSFNFSSSLSDLAVLTAFRTCLMPLLTFLAIYLYRTKKQAGRSSNLVESPLRCPLIPPEEKEDDETKLIPSEENEGTKIEVKDEEDYVKGRRANAERFDEKAKRARKTASFFKHLCLTFLFVISTGIQVYTGVKTLDFSYTQHDPLVSKTVLIVLVCGSILWINLEAWILRELVNELTRDHGLFLKSLHRHALFFDSGVSRHWCDLCSQRVSEAWVRCVF